jgi:hypothetical protein
MPLAPLAPDDGVLELAVLEADRAAKWKQVLLLGDSATVSAARAWHEAIWKLDPWAQGKRTDPDAWLAHFHEAGRLRDVYYEAARRDLGIIGDHRDLKPTIRPSTDSLCLWLPPSQTPAIPHALRIVGVADRLALCIPAALGSAAAALHAFLRGPVGDIG